MRASDLLEHRPAFIYHGTSISAAVTAITEDRLLAEPAISFSRNFEVAKRFAHNRSHNPDIIEYWVNQKASEFPHGDWPTTEEMGEIIPLALAESYLDSGGVVLRFNPILIRQRYSLQPYNDDIETDHKWENEERIIRDLHPLTRYIDAVLVDQDVLSGMAETVLSGDPSIYVKPQPQYRGAFNFLKERSIQF